MERIQEIYIAIEKEGFSEHTLLLINKHINDIQNGNADFSRFNQQEHAGLCKAGSPLIGASIVASYAAASFVTGGNASGSKSIADLTTLH